MNTLFLHHCQQCGGQAALTNLMGPGEARWFVECRKCARRTMHYALATLAVADWNNIQNDHRQPRYLGEV